MNAFSTYLKLTIFFLAWINCRNNLNAQCNPDLFIDPAYDCTTAYLSAINGYGAGFVCTLDDYCVSSSGAPNLNPPIPFCTFNSVLNNPMWFSFVTDDTGLLDLSVFTSGCDGEGIQWALYDQCGLYFNAVACQSNPVIPAGFPFEIVSPVAPHTTYYLVMDGANNTNCHYRFKVNSGITPVMVGEPLSSQLTGDIDVCPGSTITYSFSGIQYATDYEWTLPSGFVVNTNGPQVTVNFNQGMAEGVYQLCVTGNNECDQVDNPTLCWDINVVYNKVHNETLYTCPGDSLIYNGQLFAPGIYDSIPYSGQVLCANLVNLTILENYVPLDTTFNILICAEETNFKYNDKIYESGNIYNDEIFQNESLCEFNAALQVDNIDTSNLQIYASKTSLACFGQDTASLYLTGHVNPTDRLINETYIWRGFTGAILGTERLLNVTQPGEYFLEIISTFSNPSELADIPKNINCTSNLKFILPDNSVPFPDPILQINSSQPESGIYNLKIENFDQFIGGTVFVWQVPDGVEYDIFSNGLISLYLPVKGDYEICVYAKDICSTSDQVCFDVNVDKTLGQKTNVINGIKLIQNPVLDILKFDFKNLKNDSYSIKVFDINGKTIINTEESVFGYELNLNVETIISGVYLYRITNENGQVMTGKFIKI